MKKIVLLFSITLLLFACKTEKKSAITPASDWTKLLDANLSQWDTYLSYALQEGYKGEVPKDANGNELAPIGLNKTGYNVFTITAQEKEPILRVSGEIYGCVVSKKEYKNYHLKLQTKWGDLKSGLRKNKLKDSGIMYHSIGPLGTDYFKSWMLSQEFQIMKGHTGDYWSQQTSAVDIKAIPSEGMVNAIADENANFLPFGKGEADIYCVRATNNEKPNNDWNTLELICFEGKSLHIVNGKVVMILKNSRNIVAGKAVPLIKGKIQLQSEGAETFYKNIEIKEITALPQQYTAFF